jgi:hypothetical protein
VDRAKSESKRDSALNINFVYKNPDARYRKDEGDSMDDDEH